MMIAIPTAILVPAVTAISPPSTPQTPLGFSREIVIFETSALSINLELRLLLQLNQSAFQGC